MKQPHPHLLPIVLLATTLTAASCGKSPDDAAIEKPMAASVTSAVTNRVDIPASVRRNLGITFARVEYRSVSHTLRLPGRFEHLPTARREYSTPLGGRIELLVEQFQRVEPGTPLYRVESSSWQDLRERITSSRALVDSMGPLREAHRAHEQSLQDKVDLWRERLAQLEELRAAGGGSAAQFTEARATLNATQAELADVMEQDAELQARQKQVEAELRALLGRLDVLVRSASCATPDAEIDATYTVCAIAPGVVESIAATPGGLAEENGLVLTVVQPDRIRFHAKGLQSDLGRLRNGLRSRIVPPDGSSIPPTQIMEGELQIGLAADADERTIDLIVSPESLAPWARAGVSAHLEITLEGGTEELAVPMPAVVRDSAGGGARVIFRRDPANPDRAIRMDADLGISDGAWIVINSGVKEGDEVVVQGNYQLMLATGSGASRGGHFHPDGTFHEGED